MSTPSVEAPDLQAVLGRRIRRGRTELGLSLRDLARRVGVSAGFLSQVERGQVSPSLATLQAVAEALEMPLMYFVMEEGVGEHVVRAGKGKRLELPGSQIRYELRSPSSARKMLVFVATMQPGTVEKAVAPPFSTQETIYVLAGELVLALGDEAYTLGPGDSITFDGQDLISLANPGDREVSYISFITPPPF